MNQKQYGASLGGPIVRDRTFYFANVEQRRLDQSGLVDDLARRTSAPSTRGWRRSAIRARRSRPACTRTRSTRTNVLGKVDHQFERPRPVQRALQPVRRRRRATRAAPAALSAPSASAGLDNIDQTVAFSNTLTLSRADGQRNARAVRLQRSEGAADRSDRTGGQHRRRRVVRHALRQPDARASNKMYRDRRQPVASGGRARAARGRRLPLQRRHDHVSRARFAARYTFSSLANFLAGTYNNAGFTQTFGATVVSPDESRTSASTRRTSGRSGPRADAERRAALRPAVPARRSTPTRTTSRRASASPGRRSTSRRTVVRGSAGLFYDRVPLRALANALLSAGNTTDLANLRQISVSLSPGAGRRAGVSEHPAPRPCRRSRSST